ncbi:hypothetical protein IFM89_027598 [Coptis chinensis]|uniref:Phosphoribosyltransferase domain-containing protein n=1 Tax=Coptis chinensis TaxID=261450 RepID=A0A835MC82_9MAGN|nr:hypothetical protein IFM89_027598 [Coptis chinensis]
MEKILQAIAAFSNGRYYRRRLNEGDKRFVKPQRGEAGPRHVVIVDDLVQSGGTLIECQKVLAAHGATKVSAYVTHANEKRGTLHREARELSKILDEWAAYIRRKCGNKQISSSIYLNEVNLSLNKMQSEESGPLVPNFVRAEDFISLLKEEGMKRVTLKRTPAAASPSSPSSIMDVVPKDEGLIVFFLMSGDPGIWFFQKKTTHFDGKEQSLVAKKPCSKELSTSSR